MKKYFLLIMASLMTVFAMAVGRGDGSTKANAIEFDWDKGVEHPGGNQTLWYRVDLTPLYDEENPSLTLYVTNPSNVVGSSVDVSMKAIVAGQEETKDYTISARQYKSYTANASMLVRMKQTEIYLTLKSSGRVKLSAKVFESADLDETCKEARTLKWNTPTTQEPMYSAWWKVDLKPIKNVTDKDAKITITNTGSKKVNLKVGQSLDCPSSGTTRRIYELAAGESIEEVVPRGMIASVQPDEIYFGVENVESQVTMLVETVDVPEQPIISDTDPYDVLHVTDTFKILAGKHLYRISVAEMRDTAKYEPEFTYRNEGDAAATISVKMAFEVPAYGTSNTEYELAPGAEEIVVYKKNMLDGLGEEIKYIYLLTETDQDINFYGRFKHVREGKACKTNIDFNWETGHSQEARTTQWYAIDVSEARNNLKDIVVFVQNEGAAAATLKASMAFSCPYIDLEEVTRTISAKSSPVSRRLPYSMYAMMTDTIWVGLQTSQDIRLWAITQDAETKAEPDTLCLNAKEFDWTSGEVQEANDTVWYLINMNKVDTAAMFPTVVIQNMSASTAKITAELSLECPDEIENEKRSLTIAGNGTYSKKLARNMFENIKQDEIYFRVVSTQKISIQVRLNSEPEGSTRNSAIPFNETTGHSQDANANLWYRVDLTDEMASTDDLILTVTNKSNTECVGHGSLSFGVDDNEAPSLQKFTLGGNKSKSMFIPRSFLNLLPESNMYIQLEGSTALRLSLEHVPAAAFTPIDGTGLTLNPLELTDETTVSTLNSAEVWYSVSQEEIQKALAKAENEGKSLTLVLENTAASDFKVNIDIAFEFPITSTMIGQAVNVPAGGKISHKLDYKILKLILRTQKQILVRATVPAAAAGSIRHSHVWAEALDGNTKEQAKQISIGQRITQSPNTEIWYKISTNDLKKDKDMFKKKLNVTAKNAGKGAAKVNVRVTDGLASNVDILYGALDVDVFDRAIKKGASQSRDIPAQVLYALASDVDLYIWVRTTDSLVFETKFNGEFAKLSDEQIAENAAAQKKAMMLVPNVDYELQPDTTMWYLVCAPYIWTNYKYVDAATVEYELEGNHAATITGLATCEDVLSYKVPERTRTINKSGKERKGSWVIRELLDKAIKKKAPKYGVPTVPEEDVDALIHRLVVGDPDRHDTLTGYVRVRSDKRIKLRVNIPQTTGQFMRNAMKFDWEHGNVNPANATTWYQAVINPGQIPEGKDLRLHVENWSDKDNTATATIYTDTIGSAPKTKSYTLKPHEDKWHDIGNAFLVGSSDLFIQYHSDSTTHIWAEIVDARERGVVNADTTFAVCDGETVISPYSGYKWDVDFSDPKTLVHKDSIAFINDTALAEWDSICYVYIVPRIDPKMPLIKDIPADKKPVIKVGEPIDCSAATAWLKDQFTQERSTNDTIKEVINVIWEWSTNATNTAWETIPTTPITTEAVVIRYRIETQCSDEDLANPDKVISGYEYNIVRDSLDTKTFPTGAQPCNEFRWTVTHPESGTVLRDSTYYESTFDSVPYNYANGCKGIKYLDLTIKNPKLFNLKAVAKYGNRLLVINRLDIIKQTGWALDSLYDETGAIEVKWYEKSDPTTSVREGYYYNLSDGSPLVGTFYAVITVPGDDCGFIGQTNDLVCAAPTGAPAPALIPNLVRPGESINVVNLDPEQHTTIRVFTTEGSIVGIYNTYGEETFTIKAAADHGFYLVELTDDSNKSTLRYIVK